MHNNTIYLAFLRGINVGGNKKVPMAEWKTLLKDLGYTDPITILNSGNAIFKAPETPTEELENAIAEALEAHFGFPVPTIVRRYADLHALYESDPFAAEEVTKSIRLYISFLKEEPGSDPEPLPWQSEDGSYRILARHGREILSVLDVGVTGTPKAMEMLEKSYGKGITTRNWNTLHRIEKKVTTLK